MKLHPFQSNAVAQIGQGFQSGHMRQILAAPTGSGKTVMAQDVMKDYKLPLFIVDRIELVHQAYVRFSESGYAVRTMQGAQSIDCLKPDVIVASIQTLSRRKLPDWADLIIIDEAHVLHQSHIKIMDRWNAVRVLGLTATPERDDLGKYFTNLIIPATIQSLTRDGFLAPIDAYGPSKPDLEKVRVIAGDYSQKGLGKAVNTAKLIGSVLNEWLVRASDRLTICFASTVAHSINIRDRFLREGVTAEHLDAYTPWDERRSIIKRFRDGDTRVLTSVGVLSLGFDAPEVQCVIMARPTKSLMLYIQQIGRGLRTCNGKHDVMVLDHSGNMETHGYPDEYEPSGLKEKEYNQAKREKPLPKPCPKCSYLKRKPGPCESCGFQPEPKNRVKEEDGELQRLRRKKQDMERNKRVWYAHLRLYACEQNYKEGWAFHKYKAKFGEYPRSIWKSDKKPREIAPIVKRWIRSQQIRYAKSRAKYNV